MNEDLYEFMHSGHAVMRTFERAYPEDEEGLSILASYVGMATTLACQALAPDTSHESIVADYWARVKHEKTEGNHGARH